MVYFLYILYEATSSTRCQCKLKLRRLSIFLGIFENASQKNNYNCFFKKFQIEAHKLCVVTAANFLNLVPFISKQRLHRFSGQLNFYLKSVIITICELYAYVFYLFVL